MTRKGKPVAAMVPLEYLEAIQALEDEKNVGVDRKTAKVRASKKSFRDIADITFKRHEKSFEKLAE